MNDFEFVYQQIFVLEKDKSKLFLEAIKPYEKKILWVYREEVLSMPQNILPVLPVIKEIPGN